MVSTYLLFLVSGCKLNNVGIVYTMASNLKKTANMEIGQVICNRF